MKNKLIIYTCFLAIMISFSSCSMDDILIDKTTGEKKSFIIINNNIIKTTVQVRLFDDATNALIKKDMVVRIASNKKLVNLKGIYTNQFMTNNGIVNFGVDPNQDISIADPLKLMIVSSNNNVEYNIMMSKVTLTRPTNKIIIVNHSLVTKNSISSNAGITTSGIKATVASGKSPTYLTINGLKPSDASFPIGLYDYWSPDKNDDIWVNNNFIYRGMPNSSDLIAKVNFYDALDANTRLGQIAYMIDNTNFDYWISRTDGTFESNISNKYTTGTDLARNGIVVLPKSTKVFLIQNASFLTNSDLNNCPTGFNFAFDGIDVNAKPEFYYKTSRTNPAGKTYIQTVGIAQPTKAIPVYNTDELYYGNNSNTVEFADNAQYTVEPKILNLGGKDACGKTFNFKVTPVVGLVKFNMLVQAQCSGSNTSVAPSLSVMYKKNTSTTYDGLTLSSGQSTLFLADKTNYEIIGSFDSKSINFKFTTDLANFSNMKAASLVDNIDLKDIIYAKTVNAAGEMKLDVKLIYKETACPF